MQAKPYYTQDTGQPLISFVIPVYNVPIELLRQCLDSILALSLRSYERQIILVDDGSEQSPLALLTNYLDDIVYIRKPNGGLSSARNTGMQMATGKYLQFIDADDMLVVNQYEHCLDLVRFQQPDMTVFDFTNKPIRRTSYTDYDTTTGVDYLLSNNIRATACGYLFKKELLGSLRFTPGIYHEDEEFTPLLLLKAKIVCPTDAKAYYYRKRNNSITTSTDRRKMLKRLNDHKGIIMRLSATAQTLTVQKEQQALERRGHQLTMDYIYKIIVETHSRSYLDRQLKKLTSQGLYPLPDRNYTTKYKCFRFMTNSNIGLKLLMSILPYINRER